MASEAAANVQNSAPQIGGAAQRYALALLDLAKDKKTVDAVATDVENLATLARDDPGFRAFIEDPRLGANAQRNGAFAVLDRAGISGDVKLRDFLSHPCALTSSSCIIANPFQRLYMYE